MKIILAFKATSLVSLFSTHLEEQGHEVFKSHDFETLKRNLQRPTDVLLLDSELIPGRLPTFNKLLKIQNHQLKIIIVSSEDSYEADVDAFSKDALAILKKPFPMTSLDSALSAAQESVDKREQEAPKEFLELTDLPSSTKHPLMKKAVGLIQNIAQTDITVLITGESGVGKEIFARALHAKSKRARKELVGLNCASVPPNLLEAELFGSEKGSFTGSLQRRLGKFELAQNSTLLLDEVSEMDISLQAKLLRVIQEKELYRIGGSEKIDLNVRLVATTNRDLRDWVKQNNFREDLFYRLNVMSIQVPPLRERLEDVPVLAQHFVDRFNTSNPGRNLTLSIDALEQLCQYNWPGNIRELENIMTRTFYLTRGKIINQIHFDQKREGNPANLSNVFMGTLDQMERLMIQKALEVNDGNRMRASAQLGITVRTLRNKLRQYREEKAAANHSHSGGEDTVNLAS